MTPSAEAKCWWRAPSAGQVSFLAGADAEQLMAELDPLPPGAPAVLSFRPGAIGSVSELVEHILRELERVAAALFPRWLPGADSIAGPQGQGVPAVRVLAERAAARSVHFGPFLADLAERCLLGETRRWRFAAEVRAAGLARVIADAYARSGTMLLIALPHGLSQRDELVLAAAAEWLAHRGGFTVCLAGAPLLAVDRFRHVDVPRHAPPLSVGTTPGVTFPPLSGIPRQDSAAELALERALAARSWAGGRRWNYTYEPHVLGKQYRLDLFWPAEGLVVEVDGDDHRQPQKFADDRRRDVHLQLRGFDVLRFTDELVLSDVGLVVREIEQLLTRRRAK